MPQEGSMTLILICRQPFGRIIELVLRSKGFREFQHGALTLAGGSTVGDREGAGQAFVFMTDAGSASRLTEVLRACPFQQGATSLFELYSVEGWLQQRSAAQTETD
jgi:hypothetical protein